MINENELAEKLGVGKVFLWKCRKQGLPYIHLGTKIVRYDYEKVIEWFEENTEKQRIEKSRHEANKY